MKCLAVPLHSKQFFFQERCQLNTEQYRTASNNAPGLTNQVSINACCTQLSIISSRVTGWRPTKFISDTGVSSSIYMPDCYLWSYWTLIHRISTICSPIIPLLLVHLDDNIKDTRTNIPILCRIAAQRIKYYSTKPAKGRKAQNNCLDRKICESYTIWNTFMEVDFQGGVLPLLR